MRDSATHGRPGGDDTRSPGHTRTEPAPARPFSGARAERLSLSEYGHAVELAEPRADGRRARLDGLQRDTAILNALCRLTTGRRRGRGGAQLDVSWTQLARAAGYGTTGLRRADLDRLHRTLRRSVDRLERLGFVKREPELRRTDGGSRCACFTVYAPRAVYDALSGAVSASEAPARPVRRLGRRGGSGAAGRRARARHHGLTMAEQARKYGRPVFVGAGRVRNRGAKCPPQSSAFGFTAKDRARELPARACATDGAGAPDGLGYGLRQEWGSTGGAGLPRSALPSAHVLTEAVAAFRAAFSVHETSSSSDSWLWGQSGGAGRIVEALDRLDRWHPAGALPALRTMLADHAAALAERPGSRQVPRSLTYFLPAIEREARYWRRRRRPGVRHERRRRRAERDTRRAVAELERQGVDVDRSTAEAIAAAMYRQHGADVAPEPWRGRQPGDRAHELHQQHLEREDRAAEAQHRRDRDYRPAPIRRGRS